MWIETLVGEDGVLLCIESDVEEGREGVGELKDAGCADDGCKTAEVGNGGPEDEGEGPINWNEDGLVLTSALTTSRGILKDQVRTMAAGFWLNSSFADF